MANQNLSQFGENTSVSDADYTFVWDSANSISKKVSRNSWLTSPSLGSSAPVTISQTWNQIGTAFTAFKVNAVSTASASGSLLLDLQVDGVSQLKINKSGFLTIGAGNAKLEYEPTGVLALKRSSDGGATIILNPEANTISAGTFIPTNRIANSALTASVDFGDGANTFAVRNGTSAQTFNVYGTSSASNANYARLALTCGLDGNATISTQALGTGTAGTVSINGVPVGLGKGNVTGNTAIGVFSLSSNTTGSSNIALGDYSLFSNTTGASNIAVGGSALYSGAANSFNSAFGASALANTTSGSENTAVGYLAGSNATSGLNSGCNNSVFIGSRTKVSASSQTNQIVIGYDATGIGSNSVVLGNNSITKTALKGNVGIGTTNPTSNLQIAQLTAGVGTISVGAGLTTVTGVGTQFLNTFAVGQTITSAGQTLTISAIASDTSMTTNAAGAAISGQPYTLVGGTRMSVLGNGNVGIGTTSPTSKLHVAETWNNAGTTFCAIKSVITDTNSAAGSDFLELYSGASTQPLRMDINKTGQINIYGAWTDASNYERLSFNAPSAANAVIGTNKAGTGTARGLEFQTDGVTRMTFSATASAVTFTNGINAGSGSTSVFSQAHSIAYNLTGGVYGGPAQFALFSPSDGVLRLTNGATTDVNRLQLGGTTDAFPAIARDGAGIKFTGAAAGSTSWIKVPPVAVSALPLAATAGAGARAFVNDASSPTFGSAVTGGGAVLVPVYSTGSAWHVG